VQNGSKSGLKHYSIQTESEVKIVRRRISVPAAASGPARLWPILLILAIGPAFSFDAAVTVDNPRIYVATLPSVLNTRTLSDYDVRRFFTQFGTDPNGVWSNPIGKLQIC
jgi:hypothetical protein